MPWTKDKIPDQVKALPTAAVNMWLGAANAHLTKTNNEIDAIQIGWGAVSKLYKKIKDKWVKK